MNPTAIPLYCTAPERIPEAQEIARRFALPWLLPDAAADARFALCMDGERLALIEHGADAPGPIYVDWVEGHAAHRRRFGGGRGQPLAKAVGLKQAQTPSVVDATAGLGRDAFVLASLGCAVTLLERHPAIAALLADGLQRASADAEIGAYVRERMQLVHADAIAWLQQHPQVTDVVYLDPMYPHRDKSALVKKEMRAFQVIVGSDTDGAELLQAALHGARRRVVVKRPKRAPPLAERAPAFSISSPNTRYDVYLPMA